MNNRQPKGSNAEADIIILLLHRILIILLSHTEYVKKRNYCTRTNEKKKKFLPFVIKRSFSTNIIFIIFLIV